MTETAVRRRRERFSIEKREKLAALMAEGALNEEIIEKTGMTPEEIASMEQSPEMQGRVRALLDLRRMRQYARAVTVNARLLEDENPATGQKAVHEALTQFDALPASMNGEITVRFINAPDRESSVHL